jgi:ornithine cyclodeaminase/alanine dehydrogenase-like protein (mu-crystallin family)
MSAWCVFSSENGEPLAILPDGVMQRMRVGAANGLGIKYLARSNATTVGILGCGWQAGAQLMAACAVRKISSVRCFSPTKDRREAFAKEMSALLGIEVTAVDQPEGAIAGADIAMCASNSLDPIFFERWIEPGMHLSSIKLPEIEVSAIKRADRLALHFHEEKPIHVSARDLPLAKEANEHGWSARGIEFDKLPTIPDLITGRAQGRQSDQEVTAFSTHRAGYPRAAGAVVSQGQGQRARARAADRVVHRGRAPIGRQQPVWPRHFQ